MEFNQIEQFFVMGAARSGQSVARLLVDKGRRVVVFDDDDTRVGECVGSVPSGTGAISAASAHTWEDELRRSGCLVLSPGIPMEHAVVRRAAELGVAVAGEIEVAYRFDGARIVAVTGTNGKSTVTGVIGEILRAAGLDAVVAGNIGTPFSDVVRERVPDTVVLELSSFQLDTISEFKADVAVLLNVTPDHLDRYGNSFDAYARSKRRILNNADAETTYVYNSEDPVCARFASGFGGRCIPFSSARALDEGVFMADGNILRRLNGREQVIAPRSDFAPIGIHNAENAMAAVAAATPLDIAPETMRAALSSYTPLAHRMEVVRVIDGVSYINDSKATNVDAAIKSLVSIDGRVVLILGGRDKDGDFAALRPHLHRTRQVLLIGEAGPVIRTALEGAVPMREVETMSEAVSVASGIVEQGDTVLLAPACASFDMFENYQARGDAFRECVEAL